MENMLEVPQKIKNSTTIWSSSSTSRYLFEENENTNSKRYMHPHVHCSIIYNSQDMKQPKCPSRDEWIKEMWYTYTMEYYSAIKKEWNLAICNKMNGSWEHYAKWSKSDKERKILYALSYMWSLINKWPVKVWPRPTPSPLGIYTIASGAKRPNSPVSYFEVSVDGQIYKLGYT